MRDNVYNVKRRIGETVSSCRGTYTWRVRPKRREPAKLAGPCYSIDPITFERTLIKRK